MGVSRKSSGWFRVVRKKFLRSSPQPPTIILVHNYNVTTASFNSTTEEDSNPTTRDKFTHIDQVGASTKSKNYDSSDRNHMGVIAATKIQACFRAHLARRAYRALKSLVKLQAVVRGVCVRRQARIALECMQALVRLQLTVRTRQLLAH